MNNEETRRALMDPCISDEEVYHILMAEAEYEPSGLSVPFTADEIERYCKENEEISNLTRERRPNVWKRIEQEVLEAHKDYCSSHPEA